MYEILGDYVNALKYYEICLEIQTKAELSSPFDLLNTTNIIGHLYKVKGDEMKFQEQAKIAYDLMAKIYHQ